MNLRLHTGHHKRNINRVSHDWIEVMWGIDNIMINQLFFVVFVIIKYFHFEFSVWFLLVYFCKHCLFTPQILTFWRVISPFYALTITVWRTDYSYCAKLFIKSVVLIVLPEIYVSGITIVQVCYQIQIVILVEIFCKLQKSNWTLTKFHKILKLLYFLCK